MAVPLGAQPALNLGLLEPLEVVQAALDHADAVAGTVDEVPLAGLEGFVRQVVGWREYLRGVYVVHGRRLRTRNLLGMDRPLPQGFWDASTGLDPVDLVVRRVLDRGWCHHIERLMVLGNAMLLLRVDPDEVYTWFSAMFVDAYDWVMVPNVYAMSQFAGGELVTTKPYVSGSNYLRKMSDLPTGEWCDDWDALFWTFVRDHLDGFRGNPRSSMMARTYEGFRAGEEGRAHASGRALAGALTRARQAVSSVRRTAPRVVRCRPRPTCRRPPANRRRPARPGTPGPPRRRDVVASVHLLHPEPGPPRAGRPPPPWRTSWHPASRDARGPRAITPTTRRRHAR